MSEQPEPKQSQAPETITGSQILLKTLNQYGVKQIFGYPGGSVLPLYDYIYRESFHHILVRHEQGAVHAAEGYAKRTGEVGVVLVTSGPGATNAVTGIADAADDSVPLVVLSGQVPITSLGTNAFQETDIVTVTQPLTKGSFRVTRPAQFAQTLQQAFDLAVTGRPGPVVVEVPKDMLQSQTADTFAGGPSLADNKKTVNADSFTVITEHLSRAKKPIFLVGGGIISAGAADMARAFAKYYDIPVVSSLLGLGVIDHDDPNFVGMGGMHGTYAANMALSQCDFLLNIGSRFDDRLVTKPTEFAPQAWTAHLDIDPHELNKIVPVNLSAVMDAKDAFAGLAEAKGQQPDTKTWHQQIADWQKAYPLHYEEKAGTIKPQAVIEAVGRITKGEVTVATDVGQHQMWTAQYYPFKHPRQLITSGGLGTMGFGLPAAIGAQIAEPDQQVVLFVGDGGFQMSLEELGVISQYKLNLKIILLNNQTLGMVYQWQTILYGQRRSQTLMQHNPDFTTLATAYGIPAQTLPTDDWEKALADAFAKPGPALIEVPIPADEEVTPMVLPGEPNQNMINYQ
ncbi:biosynthetic-type acetolactate synthase large subunit [Lactobacillaceae bacterium L1_55_11]|nr:biosynthetic-type acetolactate synthase large subunit [Lactobacillaceae bacterium L1_55_11]